MVVLGSVRGTGLGVMGTGYVGSDGKQVNRSRHGEDWHGRASGEGTRRAQPVQKEVNERFGWRFVKVGGRRGAATEVNSGPFRIKEEATRAGRHDYARNGFLWGVVGLLHRVERQDITSASRRAHVLKTHVRRVTAWRPRRTTPGLDSRFCSQDLDAGQAILIARSWFGCRSSCSASPMFGVGSACRRQFRPKRGAAMGSSPRHPWHALIMGDPKSSRLGQNQTHVRRGTTRSLRLVTPQTKESPYEKDQNLRTHLAGWRDRA